MTEESKEWLQGVVEALKLANQNSPHNQERVNAFLSEAVDLLVQIIANEEGIVLE